jgi:acyl-CoA synthetase (AMP-forming)/AMP-acid ligase II
VSGLGAVLPPAVQKALRDVHGVAAIHAWGMTEPSPIGTMAIPTPEVLALPEAERVEQLLKQGRVPYGADNEVRDASVAAFHQKWDERPMLVIVPMAGDPPTRAEILEFLAPRMARWWLPDDVVFVAEMPMTATGKILKAKLREQYWHHFG